MSMENPGILAQNGIDIALTADDGSRTAYLPANHWPAAAPRAF